MWIILAVFVVTSMLGGSSGEGRMTDPPARNAMWRFGYPTPTNYDDDFLFCGGPMIQYALNGGKCGVCGDSFDGVREHEVTGRYYRGVIARRYRPGEIIDTFIELTSNMKGYFEFRVCPYPDDNITKEVSEDCLNQGQLELADGSGTRYYVPDSPAAYTSHLVPVKLPAALTCDHCLMQWQYVTGNSYGVCENRTEALGCGPQKMYRNCADISITNSTAPISVVHKPYRHSLNRLHRPPLPPGPLSLPQPWSNLKGPMRRPIGYWELPRV